MLFYTAASKLIDIETQKAVVAMRILWTKGRQPLRYVIRYVSNVTAKVTYPLCQPVLWTIAMGAQRLVTFASEPLFGWLRKVRSFGGQKERKSFPEFLAFISN